MRSATIGLAATLALVACNGEQSPGTGSGTNTKGSVTPPKSYEPPACGGTSESFTNAGCATCAEQACCVELEACAAGTPCAALLECQSVCLDSACVDACVASSPDGLAPAPAYDACLAGPCGVDCPQNPGVCGTTFSTGQPSCDTCVGEACCGQLAACQSDAACSACLDGFAESCSTDPLFSDLTGCLGASCASACDG